MKLCESCEHVFHFLSLFCGSQWVEGELVPFFIVHVFQGTGTFPLFYDRDYIL